MKVLLAPTEDFIKRDRTALGAAATAGSSVVLNVTSKEGIAVNDYIEVGVEGTATAEICQVSAVTETTLTVTTLLNAHLQDEPVIKYRYNKRKFYGSLTSTGSFSELTGSGSPIAIVVTNPQGTILEYSGGEGYTYFKSTYFNSTTTDESNIADADVVLADESVRYCSLYDIRKQAGIQENANIDDGKVEAKRKQAENEVNSMLYERYMLPLTNFSGNPEVPNLVTRLTYLLAAGYIDYEEFDEGNGVKWLGEARAILKSVQSGVQRLIGLDGNELSTKDRTEGMRSNNTNCEPPAFTMRQKF